MAGTLRTWVQDYVRAHRSHPTPPNFKPPIKLRRPGRSESDLGPRLASEPQVLERLVAVQPRTIAVVLASGQRPQVKRPGEQLRPNLMSGRKPSYVVVVSTAVSRLDLTLRELVTLDADDNIPLVKIRVGVQVSDRDEYAGLVKAAMLNHTDLDDYLTECVKRELNDKVRLACKMNRMADLQARTLQEVLANGWFPGSFADGVLTQRGFAVLDTIWPSGSPTGPAGAPPSAESMFRRPESPSAPTPRRSELDLTMDAGLRRLWNSHAELELLGIAGAKVSGETTVIAVPAREPAAYEETQLREAFSHYYADRHVRLVSAVADTYDEIVRAWFRNVDSWPRRLVSVTRSDDDEALQIHVDQRRLPPEDRDAGVWVGRDSDREALQRLLPYERVEFVSADQA
ncbi:MAG TPA: hypothetical protein VK401_02745 [Propionibacteriaceae bacterium]|nr:hypothetical protein [Propionibacteriaceae bacterium]